MFSDNSRYRDVPQEEVVTVDGRRVRVVRLRRLPAVAGQATIVAGNDRLDVLAQRHYQDPTMFWHIADANTELDAEELVRTPGRTIQVPES